VVAGSLILHGCVAHRDGATPEASTAADYSAQARQRRGDAVALREGRIVARAGRPGFVVAAPHGTSDTRTATIAETIAERTGFGLVVATGFSVRGKQPASAARRYHVNRPFEGVPGRPGDDTATAAARRIYDAYVRRVREAAQGPLQFYVEIHGNDRAETAARIEIATVGVDGELALRLRALGELIRDAHVRAHPHIAALAILVEPADRIVYTAAAAKRHGILALPRQALHIELPRIARVEYADVYTAVLADFLAQAAVLPAGE
jgi:hypothetical protein